MSNLYDDHPQHSPNVPDAVAYVNVSAMSAKDA
jgi:hypothetical protein